ncbi:MAG: sigma-70 family RNA polymerase sigma factor [Actinomycetaceae bacterium]|nr:sigma-70 family RNA polymerase sigma factor [Actinomycetaceae bacterium]
MPSAKNASDGNDALVMAPSSPPDELEDALGNDVVDEEIDLDASLDVHRDSDAPTHDEQWFDQLFREHATAIVKYLLRRGAYDEAEDLASEVFATAWRKREVVPDGYELPWLYRTAGWTLQNWRRRIKAVPLGDNEDLLDTPDQRNPEDQVSEQDAMRRALSSLSERDREILVLHAWDGLSGDQLAKHLGISRGGADAALSRARTRLEQAITDVM